MPRAAAGIVAGALLASGAWGTVATGSSPVAAADLHLRGQLSDIQHVVVIYQENWSFDSLYGRFPGARGWADAGRITQVDGRGAPLTSLPQPVGEDGKTPDPRIPAGLPVQPYDLSRFVPPDGVTGDLVHRYYQEQVQIDRGRNDRFVSASDNGGLVLSHYDATAMPEGRLARDHVLADNFFHSAFGGSFLNHMWLVCACTPRWDTHQAPVPASKVAQLGPDGSLLRDGYITPDGHVVNTSFTVNHPHPASFDAPDQRGLLVPNLDEPTIGDRLSDAGVPWRWYAGGWDAALQGRADSTFQFHHQPFAFFRRYADGTEAKRRHLADESAFLDDLHAHRLPGVSFIKPLGVDNEHPGYATLLKGQDHVASLVAAIQASPEWRSTAVIITYDENGGRYDHVAPPPGDRWGPGVRVPAIVVSPFARRHLVDHTRYETVSILRLIERRWRLEPLGERDAEANDLTAAFDLGS
ncbi:MAG TPA: acid phosphatase [Candidatus Dormibacteraeota bacterium]